MMPLLTDATINIKEIASQAIGMANEAHLSARRLAKEADARRYHGRISSMEFAPAQRPHAGHLPLFHEAWAVSRPRFEHAAA